MKSKRIEKYMDFVRPYYSDPGKVENIIHRLDLLSEGLEGPVNPTLLYFIACFHGLGDKLSESGEFMQQVIGLLKSQGWTARQIEIGLLSIERFHSEPVLEEEKLVNEACKLETYTSGISGLDRQGVIDLCNKLGFDTAQYRLSYGSALVMHGVKKLTHDIDMDVSRDLFEQLAARYPLLDARFGEKYICIDNIVDVFVNNNVNENVEYVDGIPVASLEHVKEAKGRLGRPKDLEDIELIDSFLNK